MTATPRPEGTLKRGLRESAADARSWTEERVREHPVGAGLGALALGFLSASLVPSSRTERHAYARAAGKVRHAARRLETTRRLEEVLSTVRQVAVAIAAEQLTARALGGNEGGALAGQARGCTGRRAR